MVHLAEDAFGTREFVSVTKAFENADVRKKAGITAAFAVATGFMVHLGAYEAAAILALPTYAEFLETCFAVNDHGRFRSKWMD